jgi:hypothetical protein
MVNVPMELLQTHLLKMSVFLELTSLPQSKPMLTMARRLDELGCGGGGRALVQCVRPAHLSHRQLYQMMGNNNNYICVICRYLKLIIFLSVNHHFIKNKFLLSNNCNHHHLNSNSFLKLMTNKLKIFSNFSLMMDNKIVVTLHLSLSLPIPK